jgi:coenzyme F420-reducing hydrogenase delta subunit
MKTNNIVAFVCNFDGLSCVEAAAQKRLSFPPGIKIVRVSCLSRVHSGLILEAFGLGASGVILLGCEDHHCHYGVNEELISDSVAKARAIMKLLGLASSDLSLVRLHHGDAAAFIKTVKQFAKKSEKVSSV